MSLPLTYYSTMSTEELLDEKTRLETRLSGLEDVTEKVAKSAEANIELMAFEEKLTDDTVNRMRFITALYYSKQLEMDRIRDRIEMVDYFLKQQQ